MPQVDALLMSRQIIDIVVVPVLLGITLNRFANPLVVAAQPLMTFISLLVTTLAVGASLAENVLSMGGASLLVVIVPLVVWHWSSFFVG